MEIKTVISRDADDVAHPRPKGPPQRYTLVAITLHWLIAALILFNLSVGFFMEGLPLPQRQLVVSLHISSGITVLALTLLRVIWRLLHEPPPFLATLGNFERRAARIVHFLLYAAMVVMPLIGWSIVSAHPPAGSPGAALAMAQTARTHESSPGVRAPNPPAREGKFRAHRQNPTLPRRGGLMIWGEIPLPTISAVSEIGRTPGGVEPQRLLHDRFVRWHTVGGFIMILLLALHLAGALKHELFDDEPELARMGVKFRVRRQQMP